MSMTQRLIEVMDAGTDAVDPEAGSMMCIPLWLFTVTDETEVAAKFVLRCSFTSSVGLSTAIFGIDVGTVGLNRWSCLSGSFKGVLG